MMKFKLYPVRAEAWTELAVAGTVLNIDGTAYDIAVPEGGIGWPPGLSPAADDVDPALITHPFLGPITCADGVIHASVQVRIGPDAVRDSPDYWEVTVSDGPVAIPATRIEEPEA